MKQIFIFTLFVSFQFVLLLDVCQGQQEIIEQKLSANSGSSLDKFGESVAISGDFAIVGAYGENGTLESSGAAYILSFDGYTWSETQKLTASDVSGLNKFGQSVSISENYAIVGAYGDNNNGESTGSAYIFYYNGNTWIEMQKLTANNTVSWDKFGQTVSISGNYAAIGAYGDSDKGESAGAVYIFHYDGSTWSQSQKLTANDGSPWDKFGQAVAILGDYAIIGAYGDSDNGPLSGSAYIFHYNGINWVQLQKLKPGDGASWDHFGQSVAISGNVAIVGAYKDDDKGDSSGSIYIFYNNGSSWVLEQKLTASDGLPADCFGYSVSISGDYTIVGAYGDDEKGVLSGSAYIFYYDGSNWTQIQKLNATDAEASDYFGKSVTIYGNYALAGAYGDDVNGESSGSAYIYNNYIIIDQFPSITQSVDISRVVYFDASQYACYYIVPGVTSDQTCYYDWDFGGEGKVIGGNGYDIIAYQYNASGKYNGTLTMTEQSAGVLSEDITFSATAFDLSSPTKAADFSSYLSVGGTVTINGTIPADIISIEVFWGDRNQDVYNNPQSDLIVHTFDRSGTTYNIRIKTIDSNGNELTYTASDDNDLEVYIPD